jgi:hypothetical protein
MLAAPGTVAAAVRGTVGEQAGALRDALSDRSVTTYVGVSLPEEMSTREVLELDHGLRNADAPCPVVTLPFVFAPALTGGDYEALACALLSAVPVTASRCCGTRHS